MQWENNFFFTFFFFIDQLHMGSGNTLGKGMVSKLLQLWSSNTMEIKSSRFGKQIKVNLLLNSRQEWLEFDKHYFFFIRCFQNINSKKKSERKTEKNSLINYKLSGCPLEKQMHGRNVQKIIKLISWRRIKNKSHHARTL